MGNSIPKDIQRLIVSCLSLNPQDRPTANQIIRLSEKNLNPSKNIVKYSSVLILLALVVWGIYSMLSPNPPSPITLSNEEVYNNALIMLNSDDPEEVRQAVAIMDSLSMLNYAPAMYELAKTYGWYSDPVSLKRKDALGIEYATDTMHIGFPKLDKYNDKSRDLYSKILEQDDSTASVIKAEAAYRMATYYANDTDIYEENYKKAKDYLLEAREYAIAAKDDSLLITLNNFIDIIDKKIK